MASSTTPDQRRGSEPSMTLEVQHDYATFGPSLGDHL